MVKPVFFVSILPLEKARDAGFSCLVSTGAPPAREALLDVNLSIRGVTSSCRLGTNGALAS